MPSPGPLAQKRAKLPNAGRWNCIWRIIILRHAGWKSNSKQQAEEHLNIAARMIEEMGYGRRKPEVEELRRQLEE
ncbi:hypothetical protein HUU40_26795 [candidate division KSB1 bacterium]|nr:hypothetical protein [candidate division KSB1 bacterium]